ncbi:MAG: hypothetical protein ACRDXE_09350 [Acidimicrobiales bacterium]
MDSYDRLIGEARAKLGVGTSTWFPFRLDGPEVQLSVRLPAGLRAAVTEAASRRGQTLTAFVSEILRHAVVADADPFLGMATDLADQIRAALGAAVADGDYATVAAEVDSAEEPTPEP